MRTSNILLHIRTFYLNFCHLQLQNKVGNLKTVFFINNIVKWDWWNSSVSSGRSRQWPALYGNFLNHFYRCKDDTKLAVVFCGFIAECFLRLSHYVIAFFPSIPKLLSFSQHEIPGLLVNDIYTTTCFLVNLESILP